MATRTKVSTKDCDVGISRYAYGFVVRWMDGGRGKEKAFPADTPLETMRTFRKARVKEARPAPVKDGIAMGRGSFTRDVVRYLKTIKHTSHFKATRSHLRPWCKKFGRGSRHVITQTLIENALAEWHTYAPRELRHRVNALRQVFNYHDRHPGPCLLARPGFPSGVKVAKVIRRRPKGVPDAVIDQVIANLQAKERRGYLRDAKTRARFSVLATCGKRPCQMMRATPADVNLTTRVWMVAPSKHSDEVPCWLNDERLAAWTLFIAAGAWGYYNHDSFVDTLRRNGWPKDLRPYWMRHQVGQTMQAHDVGLVGIQREMGHATPVTTQRHYVPGELRQAQQAAEAIEGRFAAGAFAAHDYRPTRRSRASSKVDPRISPQNLTPDERGAKGHKSEKTSNLVSGEMRTV